jgi:hypothetical protein
LGPHGDHDVDADLDRTGPWNAKPLARERRLVGFRATEHAVTGSHERSRRGVEEPVVRADQEHVQRAPLTAGRGIHLPAGQ